MKATLKNVSVALAILAVVVAALAIYDDGLPSVDSAGSAATYVRVSVTDLQGMPVHNARVTVLGQTFCTDNNGRSPLIDVSDAGNVYDASATTWKTVTAVVCCEGYVAAVALNYAVRCGETRNMTVKAYAVDASDLPYVCYVEAPPAEYMQQLIGEK